MQGRTNYLEMYWLVVQISHRECRCSSSQNLLSLLCYVVGIKYLLYFSAGPSETLFWSLWVSQWVQNNFPLCKSYCRQLNLSIQLLRIQNHMQYICHHVQKSLWLKKNRASDNEGKFHSILMCRIWIYSQNLISLLDIRVRVHLAHFWKICLFSSTSALATTSCCR